MTRCMEIPASADVVIVGGGVIGSSIAYYLARAGLHICLVERDDIGAGTTSAAAAAALLQTKTSAFKLELASTSLKMIDELYQEFDHGFEFRHSGSLLAACSPSELQVVRDMVDKFAGLGLSTPIRRWGRRARHDAHPGSGRSRSFVLSDRRADQPARARRRLCARRTATRRHDLHNHAGHRHRAGDGRRILSVVTDNGKICTETVVDAAGVWSAQVAQLAGLHLPVAPLKGELLISEAMPPMMTGTLISAKYLLSKAGTVAATGSSPAKRSTGITLVQVARGNFLVGSTREPAGFDRRNTLGGISDLGRLLLDITPSLAGLRILRAYAGLRPLTDDLLPIIGPAPELPGFIAATGHGGDGLALSALTGKLVSEIISGTRPIKPDSNLSRGAVSEPTEE